MPHRVESRVLVDNGMARMAPADMWARVLVDICGEPVDRMVLVDICGVLVDIRA